MKFHLETISEFETILNSLSSNNNNLIRALSLFAEEYKQNEIVATAFVKLITTKIYDAAPKLKIYFLYVLDCIVKNVGCLYAKLFSMNLKEIFIFSLLSIVDVEERTKYYVMRKSWNNYFPVELLTGIDLELFNIDPNWQDDVSSDESNNCESLKSLPIISSKLKSENYVLIKGGSLYNNSPVGCNKENESSDLSEFTKPLWKVEIPDYPLFPEIGTDPRLLRRWYSNETFPNISINDRSYELLLNRIQPCIFVNGFLHAVRFYSNLIQLGVNGVIFDISLVGASLIQVSNQSMYVCLGGPGHELIIAGLPHHVPMDTDKHIIRLNNESINLQWSVEQPVQVNIMPAIPTHISEWGWRGMFGSPKYLILRPLNPMKPVEYFKQNQRKALVNNDYNNKTVLYIQKKEETSHIRHKIDSFQLGFKLNRTPLEIKETNGTSNKSEEGLSGHEHKFSLESLQKLNRKAIVELFNTRRCSICDKAYGFTDNINFKHHLLQHYSSGMCYQLLNDWLVSAQSTDNKNTTPDKSSSLSMESTAQTSSFDSLANLEANFDPELVKWSVINLKSEERIRFYCQPEVTICLTKGTAEIFGTSLPFNSKIGLLINNRYEILSFTGCKLAVKGEMKDAEIIPFNADFYKANIFVNVHSILEQRRIEASQIEGRGPRILIYGSGVEAFAMSTLTRTLANYSVRCNNTIGLVNLDTMYNDTGLPNSISVNVIQSEFNLNDCWDYTNDPMVFNFGQCSPVANQKLYFEQLENLANFVNIRCENDNNLLIGGCIINGGSFHSSDIIMKAIELFEVNFLLFISDKETANLRTKVPEYVTVINIPKSLFDTSFCPKKIEVIRKKRIEYYFYGNNIVKNELYKHELNTTEITFFYTKELTEFNGCHYININLEELQINSVAALSQACTFDQISSSPILFYLLIVNISLNKSTITVLTENKVWPKCFPFILLNGIILDSS